VKLKRLLFNDIVLTAQYTCVFSCTKQNKLKKCFMEYDKVVVAKTLLASYKIANVLHFG